MSMSRPAVLPSRARRPSRPLRRTAAAVAAALCLPGAALATLQSGNDDPEMMLVIWDQTREASYTLDLGIHVSTLRTDGQSDAGFQQFWTLDSALDANLALLLTGGSAVSALQWGVTAADVDGFSFSTGDLNLYTTLRHDTPTGTVNPNYTAMLALSNDLFQVGVNAVNTYVTWTVSNASAHNQINGPDILDYSLDGSAFALKGEPAYVADLNNGGIQNIATPANNGPLMLNPIGRSSWAYMLTTSGFGEFDQPLVADEFDNLEHDAYWGLAQDPDTGILYLSYTLDAVGLSAAQREFALGIGRTEFDGGFSVRRLAGVAVAAGVESPSGFSRGLGAAEGLPPVTTPVPEPGTWALMAIGLAAVGRSVRAATRRR